MSNNRGVITYILACAYNRMNGWMNGWPKSQNIYLGICPYFYCHFYVLNINFMAGKVSGTTLALNQNRQETKQ